MYCITCCIRGYFFLGKNNGIDESLLDKAMVSGRVPKYVKKYADDKKIPISKIIMAGFDAYRENDYNHAIERLRYHEERVIHWKRKVLLYENEINTKHQLCNTIKTQFVEQGRGAKETKRQDRSWLESKIDKLISEGIPITLDELYTFCIKRNNDG